MARWFASLAMLLVPAGALAAEVFPLAEKIAASEPANRVTTIRGSAQSVPAGAWVIAANVHTGHYGLIRAASDGTFELPLAAFPGDWLVVKIDPSGNVAKTLENETVIAHGLGQAISLAGTMIRVPDGVTSATSFVDSGITNNFLPYWSVRGSVNKLTFAPGETIAIDGVYTIHSTGVSGQTPRVSAIPLLAALSRPDGSGALDQNSYCSTLMTPTGLPIERLHYPIYGPRTPMNLEAADGVLRTNFRVTYAIPADLPAGYYRPVVAFDPTGVGGGFPQEGRVMLQLGNAGRRSPMFAYAPVVKIGTPSPPRMFWTLLVNTHSEGVRGVNAVEDRGRFSVVPRIATSPERIVLPRIDARTGSPLRYNLEPFALTLSVGDRGVAINPPNIPVRLPSGNLKVTVHAPDGTSTAIGPVPFRQFAIATASHPFGGSMENGGHITDAPRLTTLDPRFDVAFARDGRHTVVVEGTIEDLWGNVWTGGGTYEIDVARPLLIESMVIPGTPLVAGNALVRAVRLIPPVAADVRMRVRFAPGARPGQIVDERVSLRANRFGWARAESLLLAEPGEYRVDIEASYRDAAGQLWEGLQTFGGVVGQPRPSIVVHGRRGTDDQSSARQQWFSRKQIGVEPGRGHLFLAFQSGDVMWLEDRDSLRPAVTVQDPDSVITPLLKTRYLRNYPATANLGTDGEIPLHSSTSRPFDLHIDPSSTDLWAYSYVSVQRPLVRVREEIAEENPPAPYWRFNDLYGMQSGNGYFGDLPNDFKFQFGAAVIRGSAVATPHYAIYGSLFVLVPNDDPLGGSRVFPPFQGNPGPNGGPLFFLKGKAIDLFFHPMTIRPGALFERNEIVTVAGYAAPTLASKVEAVITSPSGKVRTIRGTANAIGYFHDSASSFPADEEGTWKAKIKVTHDGETSAGPVQPPYPAGDVLGSREGEFSFYVVRATEPALSVTAPGRFVAPADGVVTFAVTPPGGLRDAEAFVTATMPGFLLEEVRLTGPPFTYAYDAPRLASDFPNLDLRRADRAGADVITFTFFVTGTDAAGARRSFARQIVLNGEELLVPEQNPVAGSTRRRSAR